VADVGTGSGCVAVAVAHYVPEAVVWASDDAPAALRVAAVNVAAHGLEERVTLLEGDLLEPLPSGLDMICANLPYLRDDLELPREVRSQPAHALFAADGGSQLVRRLLRDAPGRLAPGGVVLAEIDPAIEDAVVQELSLYGGHRFLRDLRGLVRVVEATLPS
jgi:HemK-like putative methylase